MKYIVLLVVYLLSLSASAFEDIVYDYNTRTPGTNIYAFQGQSSTRVPNNFNFPSSGINYAALQFNDGNYQSSIATSTNNYPSMRYVIFIDERESDVTQLDILWNGYGINSDNNKRDGVILYIWNFRLNSYEGLVFTTSSNEVNLTSQLTNSITDYLGGTDENAIVLYAVSVDSKSGGNNVSNIYTDYLRVIVSAEDASVPAVAVANFQFDECKYVGSGNEVIDQFGSYSGTSHNAVNTSNDAQIVKALAISNAQHHVRTSIPLAANFSVSTWFKKPSDNAGNRYFVLGAMSNGGDLFLLDRDNNMRWAAYSPSQGNVYGTYSFTNLDASWHHMALVFRNNETSLYIDGNYIETIGVAPSGTLGFIGTSFDEVDSANPQGFRAPIDEFVVFNEPLTSSEVTTIYNNQVSGRNYDGSTREVTLCAAAVIANFQFDECGYVGSGNEVIDQLGNYSGTSHNAVNTSSDAQIVKALAISNAQHHVRTSIPVAADFSVSTWFKKPDDNAGNRYFVLGAMSNGGDLFLLDRDNSMRWAVYNPSQGNVSGTYSFTNLDTSWHHMALVFQNNETSLYIDGNYIEKVGVAPAGTLGFIGTSFDEVDSTNPQGFRAPIDEFIVINQPLTSSEVLNIYNNQVAGKNYDASAREVTLCPVNAIANFKFDEAEYADVAGEVRDSIGSFHSQAKSAQTVEGKVCRALDLSTTGTSDYVVLDKNALNNKREFSVSLWAKTAKTGAQSFLSGAVSGSINELLMWFTRDTSFRPYLKNTHAGSLTVSSIAGDTWRHLVWTHGNNKSCLFIDTIEQGCLNQTTSTLSIESLILGQEQDSVGGGFDSSQAFNGFIDELVIFDGVIEANKIAQIYNFQNNGLGLSGEAITCPEPAVHHYEIVHDGNGLTCAAETVTIKACTNSDCSTLSTESVSLDFTITSPSDGTVIKASPTFTGSTSIDFSHIIAETVQLSLEGATVAASNAVQCSGTSTSCNMTFDNTGYILSLADHNACTTPNLIIQAVKLNDTGVSCAPAYSGDQPVDLTFNYNSPVTGTKLPDLAGTTMAQNGVAQRRIISFDANATATLPFHYQDAGEIRLSVADATVSGLASDSVITVVSPDQLVVNAPETNSACLSANPNDLACGKFKAAGEDFILEVIATCADTSITTPNFKLDNIALSLALIEPANKSSGALGMQWVNISSQGKAQLTEQSISEVGVFTITATPPVNGYFGKTIAATTSANIGRFVPDHFVTSKVFDGKLKNSNGNSFAYAGEMSNLDATKGAMRYEDLLEPEILITAKNKQGETTQNYTAGFMKLVPASFRMVAPSLDENLLEKDIVTDLASDINFDASNIADQGNGTIKYKFNNNDNFYYNKNAKALIDKYTTTVTLQIDAIEDSDGILSNDSDAIIDNGIITLNPAGIEMRFGRWAIENTFGPENADLPLPMTIQYWDGSRFIANELESAMTFDASVVENYSKDNNGLSPKLATNLVEVSGSGAFTLGRGQLLLTKPSDGSQGQIRLTYKKVPSWLKFNWNNIDEDSDGNLYDDNPAGIATFGVYRGNDRIISWREVAN